MTERQKWPEHLAELRNEVLADIIPPLTSIAPGVRELSGSFVHGQIWSRPGLSPRDRSLVTIAALAALGHGSELTVHVLQGVVNGLTKTEIGEAFTQLLPYAGFPAVVSAVATVGDLLDRAVAAAPPESQP